MWNKRKERKKDTMRICMLSSLHPWDSSISSVPQRLRNPASLFGCVCIGIAQIWRDCTLFGLLVGLIVDTIFTSTKTQDKFFSSRRPNRLILIFDLRRTQLYFSWRCYKKFNQSTRSIIPFFWILIDVSSVFQLFLLFPFHCQL